MDYERRTYLSLLATGAGAAGLVGCLGGGDGTPDDAREPSPSGDSDDRPETTAVPDLGSPTAEPAADPAGTTAGDAETAQSTDSAPTGDTLVLERIDDEPDVPLTVYPRSLERVLRRAATTDGAVRAHASTNPDNPRPVLPRFDAVEIVDETGGSGSDADGGSGSDADGGSGSDASGVYELDAEGGTRYRMGIRAEAVSRPDAAVTAVSDLPPERREVVERAIDEENPGVFPETALGEWVREEALEHYVESEGAYYYLTEHTATDAAFFSNEVWYVLSLTPTEETAPSDAVTLRLRDIGDDVRSGVDPLVDWTYRSGPERVAEEFADVPEALATFGAGTDGLLTHTTAVTMTAER